MIVRNKMKSEVVLRDDGFSNVLTDTHLHNKYTIFITQDGIEIVMLPPGQNFNLSLYEVNPLQVYINGALQVNGEHYSEIVDPLNNMKGIGVNFQPSILYKDDAVTLEWVIDLYTATSTAISMEASIRESVDIVLSTNISTEASIRESADLAGNSTFSTALSAETSIRESVDLADSTACSTAISTEVSTRLSADVVLANNISTEISFRESTDIILSNLISAETSIRESVDLVTFTNFSAEISTEVSIRDSMDLIILTGLSTEIFMRNSVDLIFSANLSTEVSIRESVDLTTSTNFSIEISTEVSIRDSMDLVISTALSTEVSIRSSILSKQNIYGSSSFIGNGTPYLFYTFETPMSDTNYIVQITPTQQPTNPGTIGEYYIIKTINNVSIINTGIAQTTFDYTITY